MIRLPCYEPPEAVLELSPEDLTRHVLALGSTGSGKTTGLMNPLLRQAIEWHADEPVRKLGLLVLDPKEDDTPDKIMAYARSAGRVNDVVILSQGGNSFYEFFGGLRRLDQVDEFASRVLFGTREMGHENAYWSEARFGLVNAALTVLLASSISVSFDSASEFLRSWTHDANSSGIQERLDFVSGLVARGTLRPITRRRLELALAEASNWRALDARTRELHKSTLMNALRPLLSPLAQDIFDASKRVRFDPIQVESGKILVASVNAVCHPQLAAVLFKALKRDFFGAVLSRITATPGKQRLCGLILDELPLSAMPEDIEALALVRSKGGFMVACSQGLSALDESIGIRRRKAMVSNFNSLFFFGSREDETDGLAMISLGMKQEPNTTPVAEVPAIGLADGPPFEVQKPVCPPGALAALPQHHAYVKLANGSAPKRSVWIAPLFHDYTPPPTRAEPDDLFQAAATLRLENTPGSESPSGITGFLLEMHRRGHVLRLTPAIVASAWQICTPKVSRNFILSRFPGRIEGLETLPSCWLLGLLQWLHRNVALAPTLDGISVGSCVAWPKLHPATSAWGDGAISIPQSLNLFLYPSLWRPLRKRHRAELLVQRPDLRNELEQGANWVE